MEYKREVWQRGPVENIPALLQPIAHAMLQAREELYDMMKNFPEDLLWERPGGVASPAFHLQHLTGVLNRLFTYAKEEALNDEQLHSLSLEGNKEGCPYDLAMLLEKFYGQVDLSLTELKKAKIDMLTDRRVIGRQKIPTTLIGLYVHAAEHTMRHIGQLLVTVRVIQSSHLRQPL
ncbi:MAG: DinB family protein [Ginsengibacter sp.]